MNLPEGEAKAHNLAAICEPIVYLYETRKPRLLTNLRASTACYGHYFSFS
jgi:hypothetical protein